MTPIIVQLQKLSAKILVTGALLLVLTIHANAQEEELRGLWVDAWGAGFKTSSEVDNLISDAQAGNYNAIFPQIRKRGDAYYDSLVEPKATDISSSYDPLADMIQKAHAAGIEVHAWIVAYPLWSNQSSSPSQPGHVYNVHSDWLTEDSSGTTWDGSSYQLDPGHPEVQEHLFDVAMDIVSRYNVDGLQFDYIRYSGTAWGYNPVSVNRFNTLYSRSGQPSNSDSDWLQFRRDQVTDLVRKVYLSAIDIDPDVVVSAATITWGTSGITSTSQWPNSAAYSSVLQDWRAWMEEGILDLNVPMTYYDHSVNSTAYNNWNIFAKDHKYDRHVAIGPGHYLNSISDSMTQIETTRQMTASGNEADGVVGYVYRVTNKDGDPRSAFLSALTASGGGDYVVDNSDSGFTASGNWATSSWASDRYGSNYRTRSVEATSDAATWSINLPSSGSYEVYAWWPEGSNRSSGAPYLVDHSGGTDTVYENQQTNGGQWNLLGTYDLDAGINQVRLSCWAGSGSIVVADAIRWKGVGGGGGPFADPATVPAMSWKTNPQDGHLKGYVDDNGIRSMGPSSP